MQLETIKTLLSDQLKDCQIQVSGGNGKYEVLAVGNLFAGLSPVKRQQLVYKVLNEYIADGRIHAVVIKTYTPNELSTGPSSLL